mmetsp:Transcript_32409/g.52499  ORF Transcript_32409/g.52499 Transcript_32409/m.52499 type:complete len:306 (+) Transcript_32409:168-1085(+)
MKYPIDVVLTIIFATFIHSIHSFIFRTFTLHIECHIHCISRIQFNFFRLCGDLFIIILLQFRVFKTSFLANIFRLLAAKRTQIHNLFLCIIITTTTTKSNRGHTRIRLLFLRITIAVRRVVILAIVHRSQRFLIDAKLVGQTINECLQRIHRAQLRQHICTLLLLLLCIRLFFSSILRWRRYIFQRLQIDKFHAQLAHHFDELTQLFAAAIALLCIAPRTQTRVDRGDNLLVLLIVVFHLRRTLSRLSLTQQTPNPFAQLFECHIAMRPRRFILFTILRRQTRHKMGIRSRTTLHTLRATLRLDF